MAKPIRIAVTGASGHIAYNLLFRLVSGGLFGPNQPVDLRLLDITPALPRVEGVAMELDDCAFPMLTSLTITDDPVKGFDGVHWALLLGSKPRTKGMLRGDLIKENGPIFVGQGRALNNADESVRIVVVGNPCNTNCLIAMRNSDIPNHRFAAMMRLDQNRGTSLLSKKAGVPLSAVTNMTIWGNHSVNQYPDFENARIHGRPVPEVIPDGDWLRTTFISTVQKRGSAIIDARGASSAASAANATLDEVRSRLTPTPEGLWFSSAVCSKGEYGVDPGLIFGYPLQNDANNQCHVVENLPLSPWAQKQFQTALDELRGEREKVKDLLPS
jgi:malate dehydrogenase